MADYAPSMPDMQTEGDFLQTPISIGFSEVLCALECAISSEVALEVLPRGRAPEQHAMGMIRDAELAWQALDAALYDLKSTPMQHPDDSTFLRVAFAIDTLRTLEQNEDAAQVFAANVVASGGTFLQAHKTTGSHAVNAACAHGLQLFSAMAALPLFGGSELFAIPSFDDAITLAA